VDPDDADDSVSLANAADAGRWCERDSDSEEPL
jgi:hypothetical protein